MFKNWKNIKKLRKNTVQTVQNPFKVLVAPLDWGLGHVTRCIPLIRYLLQKNCQISVASNAAGRALLQAEFPDIHYLELKGYHIQYPPRGKDFRKKILLQTPRIIRAVLRENAWLRRHQQTHHWDLIISDNRFGFYLPDTPSVFITHQLAIRSGMNRFTDRIIQWFNYSWIAKFSQCWVPDMETSPNLAGELSHPSRIPAHTVFIGPLSRMREQPSGKSTGLLVLLSGPEPQRSMLETKLMEELKDYTDPVVFVRGLPGHIPVPGKLNRVDFRNHLPSDEMQQAMENAGMIVCRSGYSTVMDLIALKKKAILIPTPGQTEQEYLAGYLMEQKYFYSASQEDFSLKAVLKNAELFPFRIPDFPFDSFKKTIDLFVNSR